METIGLSTRRLFRNTSQHLLPIANLFIEISDYNTQTATNRYISEDSLTNCYVALHIGTQKYFNLVETLLSYQKERD